MSGTHADVLQSVQLAAVQVSSAHAHARECGAQTLLRLSTSADAPDLVAYVVAHTAEPAAAFHALGALLRRAPALAPPLTALTDHLLAVALARAHDGTWPPFVYTQLFRTVGVLTKRAAALSDESPLAALGARTAELLAAPQSAALGLALATELCDALGAGGAPAGLTDAQHSWCTAVFQECLPPLVERTLALLDDAALFDGAVRAAAALLRWEYVHADGTPGVPASAAPLIYSARVVHALARALHTAHGARLGAHAALLQEALEHTAALPPPDAAFHALWAPQRLALFHAFAHCVPADAASAAFAAAGLRRLFADDASVSQLAAALTVDELSAPLSRLTRAALAGVAAPDADADTDADADAALDAALGAWLALLDAAARAGATAVADSLRAHVRDTAVLPYLAARLASPPDADEVGSAAEDDVDAYAEQLTYVAALARRCCAAELLHAAHAALAALAPALEHAPTDAAWEQLHWLCLVLGHVLADAAAGETPAVPRALAHGGARDAAAALIRALSVDLLAPLAAFGAASARPTSPQALASLLWFTARWAPTYLQAQADVPLADDVLPSLAASLLTLVSTWPEDADVLTAAAGVLDSLAATPHAPRLLVLPAMQELVHGTTHHLEHFPSRTHAPLLRAFLRCTNAARSAPAEVRETYYAQLTASVRARMAAARTGGGGADSLFAVLSIIGALAASADPLVSPAMHAAVLEQLPALVELARTHSAHADVLLAALDAAAAALRAAAELDAPDEGAFAAAQAHALVDAVRTDGDERAELLAAALRVAAAIAGVPAGGSHALAAFVRLAAELTDDALSEPGVPEALGAATRELLDAHSALTAAAGGPPAPARAPLADTARHASPLETVLRAAVVLIARADKRSADDAERVCDALTVLALQLGAAPAAITDAFIAELLGLLLAGDLDSALFAPVLRALRALVVARAAAPHLGGMHTAAPTLRAAAGENAALAHAMSHVTETLVASATGGGRAADARAAAHATATLVPFVVRMRGTLRMR